MALRLEHALKYAAAAQAAVPLVALAIAPVAKTLIEQWTRDDVEERSRLVYNSMHGAIVSAMRDGTFDRLGAIFADVAKDDRVVGLGLCNKAGELVQATRLMPRTFSCEKVARTEAPS
jgi:trehalose 6-phosphate synthase